MQQLLHQDRTAARDGGQVVVSHAKTLPGQATNAGHGKVGVTSFHAFERRLLRFRDYFSSLPILITGLIAGPSARRIEKTLFSTCSMLRVTQYHVDLSGFHTFSSFRERSRFNQPVRLGDYCR